MDMRSLAQRALTESALPDEAITVNQRALIDKILARYSAEFTVFRELLQNADDAGASECELRLVSEPRPIPHVPDTQALLTQWTFRNNGAPFSDADWHRLRRIAEGNPDPERIGAFGVGFYSLFSVCDEPIVSSGDQLMGFFWKGDALFTRRAHAPAQAASSTGVPWTTFLMALREPTPFPESPLALCQFLATSLTFTSHVRSVGLYLDDQLLCHLDKHVGAPEPLVPSRHLRATSPEKIMAVQELHTSPLQVHVRVARCILLEAAEAAAHLGVDDDGRIYGRVSQRAVQISEQKGLSRALKDRLRRLTDALGLADQQARRQRAEHSAASADTAAGPDAGTAAGTDSGTTAEGEAAPKAPEPQDGPAPSWSSADDSALASMLGRDPADEPATEEPRPSGEGSSRPPQAPDFGRPVGFDGGNAAAFGQPSGSEEDVPRARQGSGPGYGPGSGTTEGQPPRSYDFRYLGDETPKPTTEAEKAEFRTTLRNWGIFALALVLVMIIVAIIL